MTGVPIRLISELQRTGKIAYIKGRRAVGMTMEQVQAMLKYLTVDGSYQPDDPLALERERRARRGRRRA